MIEDTTFNFQVLPFNDIGIIVYHLETAFEQ